MNGLNDWNVEREPSDKMGAGIFARDCYDTNKIAGWVGAAILNIDEFIDQGKNRRE